MTQVDPGLLKQLAELVDGDSWVLADMLAEQFPEDRYPISDKKNGLHAELHAYEAALLRQHGIVLKTSTMRRYRATAMAWPRGARAPRASFAVHDRMRGEDRFDEMAKRLKQAEKENTALSANMLARLREEEKPRRARLMEQEMADAIARAVRRVLLAGVITDRSDWWHAKVVTDPQRVMAVRALRHLAAEIEGRGETNDDSD